MRGHVGDPPASATADAKTGRWEITLHQNGSPAPRTLVFSTPGSPSVSLTNVLFGDGEWPPSAAAPPCICTANPALLDVLFSVAVLRTE